MKKAAIRERAKHRCEYCGDPEQFSLATFHVEHIVSRQHQGGDDEANLALAYPDCNLRKGTNLAAIDPESGELTRLFHPRRDVWAEHFAIDDLTITGRTAIGRANLRLLDLNTPIRLRHRRMLRHLGVWSS